ncbi:MAG: acyl-CoA thioesterase [Patescibacteria group bacterium]|nr:acyl-CoA thioesterase [Patescibacteria group bacterium]
MIRTLIFGDSVTYGGWDTEGGWVERIKKQAHKITVNTKGNTKIQVFNLGIGGDTSRKILARIQNEIEARLSKTWGIKIILSFGINDERSKDGIIEVPLNEYQDNIVKIIKIVQSYTKDILIIDNPPIGDDILHFKIFEYSNERIQQYNKVLQDSAKDANIQFISTYELFKKVGKKNLNTYDKLHVNNKGHEIIAHAVKPFIL